MDSEKSCGQCKWYNGDYWKTCKNYRVGDEWAYYARQSHGECGPSGRYWEPKEEEE